MLYGLYISAAGLGVNRVRQEVQANNLANVATVGFKPDEVMIEGRPAPRDRLGGSGGSRATLPALARIGGGVWARQTATLFRSGSLEATAQPLDVALDTGDRADGFLAVSADGEKRWTRDGRMAVEPSGRLVTVAGRFDVLDDAGEPIELDPSAGAIQIGRDGEIRQGGTQVARLGLARFEQPEQLAKVGRGLFAAPGEATAGEFTGRVLQGYVENSAVEPTTMLAAMIETQRAYEANANMIRLQDQTLDRAVNDIARIA